MPETTFPPDEPGDPPITDRPVQPASAEVRAQVRLYVSAAIAVDHVKFAGLSYGSEELATVLREIPRDPDRVATVCIDPNNLTEVEAHLAGRTYVLQALNQRLVAVTGLVVQLGLFDPPSVKRIGPANVRSRPPGAKQPKPVERAWLPTLGLVER